MSLCVLCREYRDQRRLWQDTSDGRSLSMAESCHSRPTSIHSLRVMYFRSVNTVLVDVVVTVPEMAVDVCARCSSTVRRLSTDLHKAEYYYRRLSVLTHRMHGIIFTFPFYTFWHIFKLSRSLQSCLHNISHIHSHTGLNLA